MVKSRDIIQHAVKEELHSRKLFKEILIFGGILSGIIGLVIYFMYFANSSHGTYWLLAEFAIGLIIYWRVETL